MQVFLKQSIYIVGASTVYDLINKLVLLHL